MLNPLYNGIFYIYCVFIYILNLTKKIINKYLFLINNIT